MGRATHRLTNTSTYRAWQAMKARCYDPNNKRFKDYSGRGIMVCKRWLSKFEYFFADMGERPKGRVLDRRNNDRGYYRSNCRWATHGESTRNTRRTRMLTLNGKCQCLQDWSIETGIERRTINARLQRLGWTVRKALTTPVRPQGDV